MGCGASVEQPHHALRDDDDTSPFAARERNAQINSMLADDAKKERYNLKILMLGPGGAGKSTVVKQMKILQNQTARHSELLHIRDTIVAELLKAVVVVVEAYIAVGDKFDDDRKNDYFHVLSRAYEHSVRAKYLELTPGIAFALKDIAADPNFLAFADTFARRSEAATFYFLRHADRLCATTYKPTDEDMLNLRIPTNGAYEISFMVGALNFRVIDVGGQKSQRRKWIRCFADVNALMFLAALSDFNILMEEDNVKNRMIDALEIWQFVCASHFFNNSCIMLFLNKKDALEEKLKTIKLKNFFAEYKGDNSYMDAVAFFGRRFGKIVGKDRTHYSHVTCATDSKQMKCVIENCYDTIRENNIRAAGIS